MSAENRARTGRSTKSTDTLTEDKKIQGLSFKALLAAGAGILVAMFIVFNGEWFVKFNWMPYDSSISSPNVIATGVVLILVVLGNPVLKWIGRKLKKSSALSSGDLAIVFNMVTAASQILHCGFITVVLAVSSGMMLVRDKVITEYFEGLSPLLLLKDFPAVLSFQTGRGEVPWSTWIPIFVTWGVFFAVVIFMYQCVAVIIHRSWRHQDHLTYPTIKPILMLTEESDTLFPPIWKNRLMWIGLGIALIYRGLPALHTYFPVVPNINHSWASTILAPLSSRRFFAVMLSQTSVSLLPLWPWALALMWLVVSANVLFSIWFFAVFRAFYTAVLDAYGLGGYRGLPFLDAQPGWLFVMLGIYYVWSMRRTLAEVWMISIGKRKESMDSAKQAMSTRTAVFGSIFAFVFIIVFSRHFFSIAAWFAIPFLLCVILADIAIARFRAEAGFGYHGNIMSPPRVSGTFQIAGITDLLGGKIVGTQNFLGIGFLGLLTNTLNPNVGSTLEAFHMAENAQVKTRSMLKAAWIAIAVAAVLGFAFGWPMIYQSGGAQKMQWYSISYAAYYGGSNWWEGLGAIIRDKGNTGFNVFQFVCLLVPAALMAFLMFMHTRTVWWPFHPIGLGIGTADFAWRWTFPAFIAWALKCLVFRWGGRGLWTRMNPFFVGLLAGDFIVLVLQTAVSIFIHL